MKNSLKRVALVLSLLFVCAGCGNASEQPEDENAATTDQAEFLWQIDVMSAEVTDNLTNTQTFIMYDGRPEDVAYTKSPKEGFLYLLLDLGIDKNGTGGGAFSWKDVYVEDAQRNQFYRHENDAFLEDYNIPRLKSTNLTIGNNEGFVCFEIPEGTDLSDMKIVHETDEGKNIVAFSVKQ